MRVILCGSMTALEEMRNIETRLSTMEHTVVTPCFMPGESPENHAESAKTDLPLESTFSDELY